MGVNSPKWLNLSNIIILASNPAIHNFDETGTLQIREVGEPGKGAQFEITAPNGKWRYGSEL